MEQAIRSLDDATALRLVTTIADAHLRARELETEWTPELRQALQDAFGVAAGAATVSEGELARQALLVLAEDPRTRDALEAQLDSPPTRSYGAVTLLAAVTAALVVLQTRIDVERDKKGKLSWRIRKDAADSAVLKELIRKVLGILPGSGG